MRMAATRIPMSLYLESRYLRVALNPIATDCTQQSGVIPPTQGAR